MMIVIGGIARVMGLHGRDRDRDHDLATNDRARRCADEMNHHDGGGGRGDDLLVEEGTVVVDVEARPTEYHYTIVLVLERILFHDHDHDHVLTCLESDHHDYR